MRSAITIAVGVALGAMLPSARAVVLNPHGTGQVLVYPYYTVNAGFGTLLSIVNATNEGKALKVHVREGFDGREVLAFNLYLSPFDTWGGQFFDPSADGSGAAALATNDNSCTVPPFPKTFGSVPGQGSGVATLSTAGYTGANSDGGPTTPDRTREGYVEIIEMGTVTNATHGTLNAITHTSAGVPASCMQLIEAWSPLGYWLADASVDLSAPDGGLYGAEALINVGAGLMYAINAEAIDGFSRSVQHTIPGSATPDLGSASKDANGIVSAFVPVGAGMVQADYTVPADAISALFMADDVYNEYVIDPALNAASDWVVTFPTKRFYVDPALLAAASAARQPFDVVFGPASGGTSCAPIGRHIVDREGAESTAGDCGFICPELPPVALCFATNALAFGATSALSSNLTYLPMIDHVFGPVAGHVRIDFIKDDLGGPQTSHVLTSANGIAFAGLPAVGFLAVDYVNANITPGVLANYSGAYPHRMHATCATSLGASCP